MSGTDTGTGTETGLPAATLAHLDLKAVDLFAGLGGATTGLTDAGVEVVQAANHWDVAVQTHAANHPNVKHTLQDLRQADFATWPDFDIGWASPSCQGHSSAAQPARATSGRVQYKHDLLRSTSWAVVSLAEAKRPRWLFVENVADFRRWVLYDVWKLALTKLGYSLTENFLTASRFGVPQRRKRLFVIAHLGEAISVCDPDCPEPAFGPCIDWNDPGHRGWSKVSDLPDGPKRRIRRARKRGLGDRFIVQNVTGHKGLALTEPLRTITTADQWAVVDRDRYRLLSRRENLLGMGFSGSYRTPKGIGRRAFIRAAGNAVCPPKVTGLVTQAITQAHAA